MTSMKKYLYLPLLIILVTSCKKESTRPTIALNPNTDLPHLYINIKGEQEITSKEEYLEGTVRIDGRGRYDDYEGEIEIKGRGNNSWQLPKKPYKIKLKSKASLLGLPAYKEWILLASYLDGSFLSNTIPYEIGRLLKMPYTNHIIPVEVIINHKYRGFYIFTEDKEVGKNRINIGNDGILLELDTNYDEEWQFLSSNFHLPIMVQYPKSKDMSFSKLIEIKNNFETLENLVYSSTFPNNNYLDYFSDTDFVNYMIVQQLTANKEINHPKSTYIHKLSGDTKYRMGIIWDFDWAFGYSEVGAHFASSTTLTPLFLSKNPTSGTLFLSRILQDPHLRKLLKTQWYWFRANKYHDLKNHVNEYATLVQQAFENDQYIWGKRTSSGDFEKDLQNALNWLDARAEHLDSYVNTISVMN